jgi:arginase
MNINIIGVPLFYGCDNPGVELGPDTLRNNGLNDIFSKEHNVKDLGNIEIKGINPTEKFTNNKKMKYLDGILHANENLAKTVYDSLDNNNFPLIIGGDHSLALGSVAASGKYFKEDFGVVWVDAHGDLNTDETSNSSNIHGMPLAASLGIGNEHLTSIYYQSIKVNVKNVFILGARDLDEGELNLVNRMNINIWTMADIKKKGLDACLKELITKINLRNIKNIHLSFDIDSLDPYFVPGTGTPVKDGFSLVGGKLIINSILSTGKIKSMDFVEFNPTLDKNDKCLKTCLSLLQEISTSL